MSSMCRSGRDPRMHRSGSQDGFTLVELMVVVLIIGILVAIAIPMYNAASAAARRSTCLSNQRLIEGAVQVYRSSGARMFGQGRLNGNRTAGTADVLVPTYLKAAPKCPKTRQFYYVSALGTVTGDMNDDHFTPGHAHF
jgi:prepilin-type N-terminal cleavage/methylation domain-containing protein